MRSTQSTPQALERLCAAAGIKLTREGKLFVAHIPQMEKGLKPRGKASAQMLAHTVSALRDRPDFEALRQATRYDPGIRRGDLRVNVPSQGMSGWEEDELVRLAVTEEPT